MAIAELAPHVPAKDVRVPLLGVPVHPLPPGDVASRLDGFARSGQHHQIVTVNTDFLAIGRRNPEFRDVVENASLVVPDGAPVLWALRLRGHQVPARTTGHDIIEMAVAHSVRHGSSIFFLGGSPGTAYSAAEALTNRFGRFTIAGISAPDAGVSAASDAAIAREVADARPDFVFVGFGCPKQDFWIHRHRDVLHAVCVGVGGSYSYISGQLRRAPGWAQRAGLEWAFRLKAEPRRLLRRYVMDDMPTLLRLGREAVFTRDGVATG